MNFRRIFVGVSIGMESGKDYDMPEKKQYKKGARKYNNEALDFGANVIEKDPELKVRRYNVDAEDVAEVAADLAVALHAEYARFGSLNRAESIAKYNQLLRLEESFG